VISLLSFSAPIFEPFDFLNSWHVAATACFAGIDLKTTRLVTTAWVLLECANHSARKPYRLEVVRLRDDLGLAGDLYEPLAEEVAQAWQEYAQGIAGTAGIVDLVSFAVMRRLGITDAFTNDKHFTAAGFNVLF